ncbi:hypothetical protein [Salidesulfovibrio brasiliensis]|uniref:hypothetical protein n=1 Tax=Salidesulfovibrio brasiliensis TaxID=221711 RepID=UPI0006D24910|nr:hypothetical protein [Salidesulfovibrio brasiliensis]
MKRCIPTLLLILLAALSGCLPSTVEPMVYEQNRGLPESWLGEWQYVPKPDESPGSCGRLPVLLMGKAGSDWYAEAANCGESFSGRFTASRVPGTDIRAVSFPVFTIADGDRSTEFKNVFFLIQSDGDRLYCWDLLNAEVGVTPWRVADVKKWLAKKADLLRTDKAGLVFQRTKTE